MVAAAVKVPRRGSAARGEKGKGRLGRERGGEEREAAEEERHERQTERKQRRSMRVSRRLMRMGITSFGSVDHRTCLSSSSLASMFLRVCLCLCLGESHRFYV